MTGLTPDDISRLKAGLVLTRRRDADGLLDGCETTQEARIMAILRDDSDARMLLDVARAEIGRLERAQTFVTDDLTDLYVIKARRRRENI